jgi:HEAT repeat protein
VAAARALALVGSNEDLAVVNRLLRDPVHRVRLAAISCLGRVADRESLRLTLDLALGSERIFRGYLFGCLLRHGQALLEILLEALPSARASSHACAMLELIAELGDPRYLDGVLGRVGDPDACVRRAAARALARFPHPRSSLALRRLLRDGDADVRAAAASALGLLHAVEARGDLAGALTDVSPKTRRHAALALRMLGSKGSEALREHLASPSCIDAGLPRYALGLSEAAVRIQAGIASS